MKTLSITLLLSLASPLVFADDLTQADRETLLEKLEAIRNDADAKVDARFRAAIAAYRNAMSSEDAAIDLYLKCEEMVNFQEQNKKSGDFRDWKRKNSDKLSDKYFKMALRQQLRWLVLTLEAASEDPDRDKLAAEAGKVLESVMTQAEDLAPHRNVLQQSVTSSVFARAYDINSLKVEKWPLSPAQIQPVYEQVILPPLRRPDRLASLRAAWTRRMVQEGMVADLWSGKPDEKKKGAALPNTTSLSRTRFQNSNGTPRWIFSKPVMNAVRPSACSHTSRNIWRTIPRRNGPVTSWPFFSRLPRKQLRPKMPKNPLPEKKSAAEVIPAAADILSFSQAGQNPYA